MYTQDNLNNDVKAKNYLAGLELYAGKSNCDSNEQWLFVNYLHDREYLDRDRFKDYLDDICIY